MSIFFCNFARKIVNTNKKIFYYMSYKHIYLCIAFAVGMLTTACQSELDLTNIDPKAEIQMGVALPVGSYHATMGNFLGASQLDNLVVDELGIFHFMKTMDFPTKPYRKIDVTSYIIKDATTLEFPFYDNVKQYLIPGTNKIVTDGTIEVPLKFNLELSMQGINNDTTQERIDSMWVTHASFISHINIEDFNLEWDEIAGIELVLGDQFRPNGGNDTVHIPLEGTGYGTDIPINVDDFTLLLMKDKSKPSAGTVDKIEFQIIFRVRPRGGHILTLGEGCKFKYNLQVKVIDYDAIWGWFQAGSDMGTTDVITMDSLWGGWNDFKRLKIRFAEPIIDIHVSHKIAAPLRMYIDYITAIDSAGVPSSATWDGDPKHDFPLKNSLSPMVETIGDSVYNTERFSYEPNRGHIDQLFDVRPDMFKYSFYLWVDQNPRTDYPWKQHRITKDVAVSGYIDLDMPFKFNDSTELRYSFALGDINLSRFTLDSLLSFADVKTSTLKIIMDVENSIPFDVACKIHFLDKDSAEVPLALLSESDGSILHFGMPEMNRPSGSKYGYVSKPSETRVILNLDKDDFDLFTQVKSIRFDASLENMEVPCILEQTAGLRIHIGLAAKIDAVLDLNKTNNN